MNPVFVAIDTPDLARAAAIARDVRGLAGGVKLGLEFFSANGPEGVREIAAVEPAGVPRPQASRHSQYRRQSGRGSSRHLEPAILTVHAAGGREMLAAAKAAAPAGCKVVGRHRPHQPRLVRPGGDRRRPVRRPSRSSALLPSPGRRPRRHRLLGRGSRRRPRSLAGRIFRRPRRPSRRRRRRRPEARGHARARR